MTNITTGSADLHIVDSAAPSWLLPDQRAIWMQGYLAARAAQPSNANSRVADEMVEKLATESDPQTIAAVICETIRVKDAALRCAVDHLEHMAAWVGQQNAGYSFEGLGEDMPGMRAALSTKAA